MNARQRKTLVLVFTDPPPASLDWAAIESLFLAVGCVAIEGAGSRVRFERNGRIAAFHRPHPQKEASVTKCRYQVRDAREFLEKIGVKP